MYNSITPTNMNIQIKKASDQYREYQLDDATIGEIKFAIEKSGHEIGGKIVVSEHVSNRFGLTPRHMTENFENVIVEIDPALGQ